MPFITRNLFIAIQQRDFLSVLSIKIFYFSSNLSFYGYFFTLSELKKYNHES